MTTTFWGEAGVTCAVPFACEIRKCRAARSLPERRHVAWDPLPTMTSPTSSRGLFSRSGFPSNSRKGINRSPTSFGALGEERSVFVDHSIDKTHCRWRPQHRANAGYSNFMQDVDALEDNPFDSEYAGRAGHHFSVSPGSPCLHE